jgi:hypothetical protein
VFSALRFYSELSSGDTHVSGAVAFSQQTPAYGLEFASATYNSLIWVDGIYADSLLQEQFVSTLLRGEVPTPLVGRASRSLQSRIVFTAPEALAAAPQTILAALGLATEVCAASLRSSHCLCSRCGADLVRYTSARELIAAIVREWGGRTISVSAQLSSERASSERLLEWATRHGFSIVQGPGDLDTIHLDRVVCTSDALTPVGALLHSLWRVPDIRFVCADSQGEHHIYAPTGWCTRCSRASDKTSKTKLLSLLTLGTTEQVPLQPEALLVCEPSYSVKQLLSTPIRELHIAPDSLLCRIQELLTKLSLDSCSFGMRADQLDAHVLAAISIASSLLAAKSLHDQIVLDLPKALLVGAGGQAARLLLEHESSSRAILIVGSADTPGDRMPITRSIDGNSARTLVSFSLPAQQKPVARDFILRLGDLLQVSHEEFPSQTLFYDISSQLAREAAQAESAIHVAEIPLFSRLDRTRRVVGGELGLLEPLANLYAASLDARSHGLSAKDFTLFGTRSASYACSGCYGLGVLLHYHEQLPRPLATPCSLCRGLRCKQPVSSALFRGVAFSTALNQPIERSRAALSNFSTARKALDISAALGLHHLPLGMPVALLSARERRKLSIAAALRRGRSTKPVVIILEAPNVDLYVAGHEPLVEVRDAALGEGRAVWIEVE